MKKFPNIWLNLAVLLSFTGLGGFMSCSKTVIPDYIENQISYNSEITDIHSVVWERSSQGVYSFYLSPVQNVVSADQLGSDYLKIETGNITGFNAQTDAFTLKYGGIELNEKSKDSGCSKFVLQIKFDFTTSAFDLKVELCTKSGDVLAASYSGQAGHLTPAFAQNQIIYKDNAIKIESVLWEAKEDGKYDLYLSPRKRLQTFEELIEKNDYLKLETMHIDGAVKENYKIVYSNLQLTPQTSYIDVNMSVNLENDKLVLKIYALTQDMEELNAGYEGAAMKIQPMQLNNQWQLNRETAKTIYSSIEWRNKEFTDFYLSDQTCIHSPEEAAGSEYIKITVSNPVAENIDLSKAEGIQIVYGSLDSKEADILSGSLRIYKNDKHNSLIVQMDAVIDGNRLRADWNGKYTVGYISADKFDFTTTEGELISTELNRIFVNSSPATNTFAFGLNPDAQSVEDLKDRYAVQFNVSNLNQEINLEQSQAYNLKIFDYINYVIYDSSKELVQGKLNIWNDGTSKVYFELDAILGNGIHVTAEWFGDITDVDEFDITPVKPFHPNFKITQENGDVTKDEDVIELQIRDNPNFQSNISGAAFDAFEFYFVNKYTEGAGVDDPSATPVLVVNKEYIGQENIDLTQKASIFDFQYLPFNNSGIASPSDWSGTTDNGTLTIIKDGDNWKISFSVLDFGKWWSWGEPNGTKATFTAEWEGRASEYRGNK